MARDPQHRCRLSLRRSGGLGGRSGGSLPRCNLAGALPLDVRQHVLASDPAGMAGTHDLGRRQAVLAHEHSHGRRHASVRIAGLLHHDGDGRGGRGRWLGRSGGRRRRGRGGRSLSGRGRCAPEAAAGGAAFAASPAPRGVACDPAASSITAISAAYGTVCPSCTRISRRMPANGEGTSAFTLSVITSSNGSSMPRRRRRS